jgi:hypothetical protein
MKKLFTNIKLIARLVAQFFVNCFGWCRSVWTVYVGGIMKPRSFYGYDHFEMAKRYSLKRERKWPAKLDQLYREQAVLPYGDTSLIVLSKREIKNLQKHGMVNDKVSYKKIFKSSYFNTKKQAQ